MSTAQMASKRDYYEVLGVARDAAADVIKRAYKKLAAANHPDRNKGDEAAVERFKEAAEAYDVLSNPDKRSRYDRFGHEGLAGAGGRGAGFGDIQDIFDAFGDLFGGGIFGGGRSRRGGRVQRGDSLRTQTKITLVEAAQGCQRTIEIERPDTCDTCSGNGARPGTTPDRCDYCGGHGQVVQSQGFFRMQTTCPACRGEGSIVRDKCGDCRGSGFQSNRVKLDVTVPAGVDNGMQLCVRGEGAAGPKDGPRGDVYVDILVEEHPLFHREGLDLTCRVPVTYTQAALGAELVIPLLGGEKHRLNLSKGTQPGEVFRLRRQGMPDPHGRGHGDLYIEIQVEVPKKLSDEQEQMLRQLAELEDAEVTPHRKSWFEKVKEFFTGSDDE